MVQEFSFQMHVTDVHHSSHNFVA